jgi:hypothetical protein
VIDFAPGSTLSVICFPSSLQVLSSYLFTDGEIYPGVSSPVETVTFAADSKLRQICGFAFDGCECPKRIHLPASVEQIFPLSFAGCGLERIEIESGNRFYRVSNGCITCPAGTRIIRCFGRGPEIEIPDDVEILGSESFY